MVHAFGARSGRGRNFIRIFAWLAVSGACWILGGLADPQARMLWWSAAVAIEFTGPVAYFRVPGMGASATNDWGSAATISEGSSTQ